MTHKLRYEVKTKNTNCEVKHHRTINDAIDYSKHYTSLLRSRWVLLSVDGYHLMYFTNKNSTTGSYNIKGLTRINDVVKIFTKWRSWNHFLDKGYSSTNCYVSIK